MRQNAKEKYNEMKRIDKATDYDNLVCAHTNERIYNFNIFRRLRNLASQKIDKMKWKFCYQI